MKQIRLYFAVFLSVFWITCSCAQDEDNSTNGTTVTASSKTETKAYSIPDTLSVMTYNILWAKATSGGMLWSNRRQSLINMLLRHHPDVIGIQEGFIGQLQDINAQLNYKFIGFGTDDGISVDENPGDAESMNAIFYNPNKLVLQKKGVFWYSLANTTIPDRTGYTDTHYRHCVWGKFNENCTVGKTLFIFNTHFCLNANDRDKNAQLLLSKIHEIAGDDALVIVTGDFNSAYQDDVGYKYLTNTSHATFLTNAKEICTSPHIGPEGSAISTDPVASQSLAEAKEIDYVFTRNMTSCIVHKTISDYEGSYYSSDHLPVLAVLTYGDYKGGASGIAETKVIKTAVKLAVVDDRLCWNRSDGIQTMDWINVAGNKIASFLEPKAGLSLQRIPSGFYIAKIKTDNGISFQKFRVP